MSFQSNSIMSITIPNDAPFTGPQRMWLKGFLDGIVSSAAPAPSVPQLAPAVPSGPVVHVLWGSQTGTAESLARRLSKELASAGVATRVHDMADVGVEDLMNMGRVLVLTSTYGDGEAPDNAAALHAALSGASGVTASGLEFAVLALGDSSYPEFCRCGHDFHRALEAMGGVPLRPVAEGDVDFDDAFARWSEEIRSACLSR